MGVFKEIEKADGSGVTTFYRLSDVHDTVETDDSEGTATVIKTKGSKTKQIKNIEVGDVVTDAEGNGTEVIKIYKHTIPETYNITLSNGDTLVASPCHKFSIKGRYRYACQVVKDHKLDRGDGSTFDVTATEIKQEEMEVYEILTKSGTYTLANGIICECEAI